MPIFSIQMSPILILFYLLMQVFSLDQREGEDWPFARKTEVLNLTIAPKSSSLLGISARSSFSIEAKFFVESSVGPFDFRVIPDVDWIHFNNSEDNCLAWHPRLCCTSKKTVESKVFYDCFFKKTKERSWGKRITKNEDNVKFSINRISYKNELVDILVFMEQIQKLLFSSDERFVLNLRSADHYHRLFLIENPNTFPLIFTRISLVENEDLKRDSFRNSMTTTIFSRNTILIIVGGILGTVFVAFCFLCYFNCFCRRCLHPDSFILIPITFCFHVYDNLRECGFFCDLCGMCLCCLLCLSGVLSSSSLEDIILKERVSLRKVGQHDDVDDHDYHSDSPRSDIEEEEEEEEEDQETQESDRSYHSGSDLDRKSDYNSGEEDGMKREKDYDDNRYEDERDFLDIVDFGQVRSQSHDMFLKILYRHISKFLTLQRLAELVSFFIILGVIYFLKMGLQSIAFQMFSLSNGCSISMECCPSGPGFSVRKNSKKLMINGTDGDEMFEFEPGHACLWENPSFTEGEYNVEVLESRYEKCYFSQYTFLECQIEGAVKGDNRPICAHGTNYTRKSVPLWVEDQKYSCNSLDAFSNSWVNRVFLTIVYSILSFFIVKPLVSFEKILSILFHLICLPAKTVVLLCCMLGLNRVLASYGEAKDDDLEFGFEGWGYECDSICGAIIWDDMPMASYSVGSAERYSRWVKFFVRSCFRVFLLVLSMLWFTLGAVVSFLFGYFVIVKAMKMVDQIVWYNLVLDLIIALSIGFLYNVLSVIGTFIVCTPGQGLFKRERDDYRCLLCDPILMLRRSDESGLCCLIFCCPYVTVSYLYYLIESELFLEPGIDKIVHYYYHADNDGGGLRDDESDEEEGRRRNRDDSMSSEELEDLPKDKKKSEKQHDRQLSEEEEFQERGGGINLDNLSDELSDFSD